MTSTLLTSYCAGMRKKLSWVFTKLLKKMTSLQSFHEKGNVIMSLEKRTLSVSEN